jgi:hypothetical protein
MERSIDEILSGPIDETNLAKPMCQPYETLQGLNGGHLDTDVEGLPLDRSRPTEHAPCQRFDWGRERQ